MKDRPMFLEPLEVQALLEAPNTRTATGLRNRCIMWLMYEAGLRVSEVLALKPRDVNIRERRVEILWGKGAKSRTAYFRSVALSELLERWKEIRPESEYLFCNIRAADRGGQVAPRNIQRAVAGYALAAGIPGKVTPHTLRHTAATEMMRRGVNLRVVQEALGHERISTTQVYTHVVRTLEGRCRSANSQAYWRA